MGQSSGLVAGFSTADLPFHSKTQALYIYIYIFMLLFFLMPDGLVCLV